MKKSQLLVAALCVSALVLGSCTTTKKSKKKKSSSSADVSNTSAIPGTSSTSATSTPSGTSSTSGTSSSTPVPGTSSSGSTPVIVPVDSVSVSPASKTLEIGESVTLVATVSPSNATNKNVSWSVSPASGVVTVSQSGVVEAVAAGDATVTVTTQDGGKTASASIHVNPAAPSWSADQKALFAQYSYGVEIPYMAIEGAELYYDDYYSCLTYGGGESSAALIDEYAALFGEEWNVEKADEETYGYAYEGGGWFETEAGDRYLGLLIYALDEDDYLSVDGTGTFGLDISDPLYYSWADFEDELVYAAQYILDDESFDPKFPAFTGNVDYIEANSTYIDEGEYWAFVSGPSAAEITAYVGAFASASAQADGWVFDGSEASEGITFYSFHNGKLSCSIANLSGDLLIDISFYVATAEKWPGDLIDAYISAINPTTASFVPDYAGGETYRYYEDGGVFYCAVYGGEVISQAKVDEYINALSEDMFEKQWVEGTDSQTGEAYAYWVVTSKDYGNVQFAVAFNEAADETSSSYVFFQIQALSAPYASFPSDVIQEYYAGLGVAAPAIPAYPIEGAYYRHEDAADEYFGGFTLEAQNTVSADLATYAALFTEEDGWTVTQDQYGDYTCEKGLVKVEIQDWISYYGFIAIIFSAKVWSAEQIKAFQDHLNGIVPPYLPQFSGLAWDDTYEEFSDYLYASNCVAAVEALLVGDEWEADSGNPYTQTIGETDYTFYNYYKGGEEEYAVLQLYVYAYDEDHPEVTGISLYYYVPATDWTEEEVALFEETLGGYCPEFNEYTSSLEYYNEEIEGDTYIGFDENLEGDQSSGVVSYISGEGFAFSESYEDTYGDTHNVYAKAVESGTVYYDICAYEYEEATYTYVDLTFQEGGDIPPVPGEGAVMVLSKDIMSDSSGYHNVMLTVTVDADHAWSIKDANNNSNNGKWDFVKLGQKGYDHKGDDADFIETEFVTTGSTITIKFKGNGTVDGVSVKNVALDNITAIRVYVSDTAFGQALCTDESKLIFEATDLPTGSADLDYVMNLGDTYTGYFQIVIEHQKDPSGKNNGFIVIKGVTIA